MKVVGETTENALHKIVDAARELLVVTGEIDDDGQFSPCPHPSLSFTVCDEIRPWIEEQWRTLQSLVGEDSVSDPYRTPGHPQGRLIHDAIKVFFTKPEWDDLLAAAEEDGRVPEEWISEVVAKALRARSEDACATMVAGHVRRASDGFLVVDTCATDAAHLAAPTPEDGDRRCCQTRLEDTFAPFVGRQVRLLVTVREVPDHG